MTATREPLTITPRRSTAPAPLSYPQEQLYLLAQMLPPGASAAYDIPALFRSRRRLDAGLLREALTRVVARHEILRTRIEVRDGVALQQPVEVGEFELAVLELGAERPRERRRLAEQFTEAFGRRPFDMARDVLLRAALIRISETEDRLLVVLHHAASDRLSRRLLFGELDAIYSALSTGTEPALPELPVQYADYAAWQRREMTGARGQELLAYWTEQLAGAPERLELPTDHGRPPAQSYHGAIAPFPVPAELGERVRGLPRSQPARGFTVLLAAFAATLHRPSGPHAGPSANNDRRGPNPPSRSAKRS